MPFIYVEEFDQPVDVRKFHGDYDLPNLPRVEISQELLEKFRRIEREHLWMNNMLRQLAELTEFRRR